MRPFIGRKEELLALKRIDRQKKAALIVGIGRRRVGKSRLIEEFGKSFPMFLEIQGLAPSLGQTNQDQLDHFSKELSKQLKIPEFGIKDWSDAFILLMKYIQNKRVLVFLDEISWMGRLDADFPGKLKIAWDQHFKKNTQLRLVLCGSVSSWIQKNILNSTNFIGRISHEIHLQDLSLAEAHQFWGKRKRPISDLEKLRILNLTGGIPRYLEEIDYSISAEENYRHLCFDRGGFLFTEFEKIFDDIFGRRSNTYFKIVKALETGSKKFSEIAKTAKISANHVLTEYLTDLELSGFIRKETMWDLATKRETPKIVHYRLKDCYVRFYLKFIQPYRTRIEKNIFRSMTIEKLPAFDIFTGLQFESLIQNNLEAVVKTIAINPSSIINAGPFVQTKTARHQGCQIDLLIQTKNTLYLCELKAKNNIRREVILEMQNKVTRLNRPKTSSIRTILIYAGELANEVIEEEYFDQIISLNELLNNTKEIHSIFQNVKNSTVQ